jgi:hypothetical protein
VHCCAELPGNVDSRQPGHLNVEEDYVRPELFDHLNGFDAVGGDADDVELRPELAEMADKLIAKDSLVFSDNGRGPRYG